MDMNKGIDAQVSDRVDAYRGQPQQLMQMYQQNKELVDLLALQKLKSEKEAAKRQIEMQMQQQPGTVAQQREQEVMQMTKDELAKQTQGVLQRKQQQQQVNMQRAAQGGLGALAQNRPAPAPAPAPAQGPTPMMAGGGIVAFQPGGSVQSGTPLGRFVSRTMEGIRGDMDDAALRQRVQTLYGPYAAPVGGLFRQSDSNRARARSIIDKLQAGELSPEEMQQLVAAYPQFRENAARVSETPTDELEPPEPEPGLDPSGPTTRPNNAPPAEVAQSADTEAAVPELELAPTMGAPERTGISALTLGTPQPAPAPATAAEAEATATTPAAAPAAATPTPTPTAMDTGIAALGAGSMGGAENALMRGVKIGEDVLGRDEKAAKYAEYEAQLAELDKDLYDPEAERRQQLQAFLIGTAGATNVGYAMAGGAAASINLENQQKRNRRDRMLSRIQLGERGMSLDSEMGRAALSLGNQMFADFNANKRAAISAGATLGAARLRAATADADRAFQREKQDDSNALQMRELDIREAGVAVEQARNEELSLSRRVDGVLKATNNLLQRSADITERATELYGVQALRDELNSPFVELSKEEYDDLKLKLDTAIAESDAWATQYLENYGINDTLQELERQYYELTGVDNMPGVNVTSDDIVDVQTQGE